MKNLNLKNMKETLVNYSGDNESMNDIWNAFKTMANCGFIDSKTWEKFFDQCKGWYIDEENACIRDESNAPTGIDSFIWKYNPEKEYKA